MLQNRILNARLPSLISTPKRKHDGNEEHVYNRNPSNQDFKKQKKRTSVKNKKMNPEWSIKNSENYSKLFHANKEKFPKRNSTASA